MVVVWWSLEVFATIQEENTATAVAVELKEGLRNRATQHLRLRMDGRGHAAVEGVADEGGVF